jgi:hypothetical protein
MMEKTSPRRTSKDTSVSARTPPKRSETCSAVRIGVPAAPRSTAIGGNPDDPQEMLRCSAEAADMAVLLSHHPYPPDRNLGALLETKVR